MKKYFNEGLLPDEYVEEGFRRLLEIRKGTIGEAFRKVAREMSVEYRENYYDFIYELESIEKFKRTKCICSGGCFRNEKRKQ